MPHGADAVVQIEDTEVVGRSAAGLPVVNIKKVRIGRDVCVCVWGGGGGGRRGKVA